MRTYEVTVTGQAYSLPVSFGAIRALDENGVDVLAQVSILGKPPHKLSPSTSIALLAVGISLAAGIGFDDAADVVVAHGVVPLQSAAAEYLLRLTTGDAKPGKETKAAKKSPPAR